MESNGRLFSTNDTFFERSVNISRTTHNTRDFFGNNPIFNRKTYDDVYDFNSSYISEIIYRITISDRRNDHNISNDKPDENKCDSIIFCPFHNNNYLTIIPGSFIKANCNKTCCKFNAFVNPSHNHVSTYITSLCFIYIFKQKSNTSTINYRRSAINDHGRCNVFSVNSNIKSIANKVNN
ncbi:hypothetical protein Bbelb_344620 [Branchiostoma belcheri]|nr:hypothetical protein Bbelb_344620 [Branchiostoma belcheri]